MNGPLPKFFWPPLIKKWSTDLQNFWDPKKFLVTEYFFNLILEVSHVSCMWKVVELSPIVFLDMQQSKSRFLTTTAFLTHISKGQLISKCLFGVNSHKKTNWKTKTFALAYWSRAFLFDFVWFCLAPQPLLKSFPNTSFLDPKVLPNEFKSSLLLL